MVILVFFKEKMIKLKKLVKKFYAFPLIPVGWSTNPPNDISAVNTLIQQVVGIALNLVGFVALIFIFLGGIQWITANGEPGQIEKGKQTLIYALAGFVLVIVSGSLVKIVISLIT